MVSKRDARAGLERLFRTTRFDGYYYSPERADVIIYNFYA
jgi:hypothetical protein